jgi:hypothetical protein
MTMGEGEREEDLSYNIGFVFYYFLVGNRREGSLDKEMGREKKNSVHELK